MHSHYYTNSLSAERSRDSLSSSRDPLDAPFGQERSRDPSLEDLDSTRMQLHEVPKNASQTVAGSAMIQPLVEPVTYKQRKDLDSATIREFNLDEADQNWIKGRHHKVDHVKRNRSLAQNFRHVQHLSQTFKRSVLSKNNFQNLLLIKRQVN